ncbi:SIS domain-containing protein [Halalkalibaculum sp. DA384]|uniref:SIS domain-containing protein n=1 Tax=Halalkalibaculum sp. DA384 TaxID=3373606 RepID=UPI0037541ED1
MSNLFLPERAPLDDETGRFTSAEIARQPETWEKTWTDLRAQKKEIASFLEGILAHEDLNIVLTGAGSSAFIGDSVASTWQRVFSRNARAVPTTDLVTDFDELILTSQPLLLISFGRSGNSPESRAVVDIANRKCDQVFHLLITCNPEGELAQMKSRDNSFVFLLPEGAEDQSLAMTNSFTSMALAALLIPSLFEAADEEITRQIQALARTGNRIIGDFSERLFNIAETDFSRIVFLGSGPLLGIARESHLKVQELTNGRVVGKFDSFLGFRHGPKAIINDETLLVYLLSNDEQTRRYERDLVQQIARHDIDVITAAVADRRFGDLNAIDFMIQPGDENQLDNHFWAILCTLPSQIIGFYKSIQLSLNPDNPSPEGTISRVVEGVRIYSEPAVH